jgi:hypothetical protein
LGVFVKAGQESHTGFTPYSGVLMHDIEAFKEACRRYLHVEGENVERAFTFYLGATIPLVAPSAETIEWAKQRIFNKETLDE